MWLHVSHSLFSKPGRPVSPLPWRRSRPCPGGRGRQTERPGDRDVEESFKKQEDEEEDTRSKVVHLGPQSQLQQSPLSVRQQLGDGLRYQGHKVSQHPIMLHTLLQRDLPHGRRQQAERRDEEAQGRQGDRGHRGGRGCQGDRGRCGLRHERRQPGLMSI